MEFTISEVVEHVLVLGAGASVDYGLPVWRDLSLLVKEKINNDTEKVYKYKKEMLAWIDKVGEGKKYDTIDKCIEKESISEEYNNGDEIENQIFLVIKDIFKEKYQENSKGWIRTLNDKILNTKKGGLENRIAFINYNYDNVLARNFLIFSYLHPKQQRYNYKEILYILSRITSSVLYPHGNFFAKEEPEYDTNIQMRIRTMKSNDEEHLDVVSCYESEDHVVAKEYSKLNIRLYLLGLGGGLKINLESIEFGNSISEIHITIKDASIRDGAIKFLSEKYKIPMTEIKIYDTCDELIKKCFND